MPRPWRPAGCGARADRPPRPPLGPTNPLGLPGRLLGHRRAPTEGWSVGRWSPGPLAGWPGNPAWPAFRPAGIRPSRSVRPPSRRSTDMRTELAAWRASVVRVVSSILPLFGRRSETSVRRHFTQLISKPDVGIIREPGVRVKRDFLTTGRFPG